MTLQAWVVITAIWSGMGIAGCGGYLFSPSGVNVRARWRSVKAF